MKTARFPTFSQLLILVVPFITTGCPWGETDAENENNPIIEEDPESAVEKCINVMEWACTEGEECYREMSSVECIDHFNIDAQCENAVAVRNSYYDCRTEIYDWDCTRNVMPESCRLAFVFDDSGTINVSGDTALDGNDSDPQIDIDTDGPPQTDDPVALCEYVVEATCNHMKNCQLQGGTEDAVAEAVRSQCLGQIGSVFNCDAVTAVENHYDTCVTAINQLSCATGEYTVSECENVFQY